MIRSTATPSSARHAARSPVVTPARAKALIRGATRTVTEEHQDVIMPLRGELPDELRGVLFRNGPGRFERGGVDYGHLFDGDGMVCRYAFDDDGVRFSNRFVRTRCWQAEEKAQRILYRGFGTNLPGGMLGNALRIRFKNAANTHVVQHGGRLMALWEGGLPHRLHPTSLQTLGTDDFDGQLRNPLGGVEAWLSPDLPFAAHPKIDEATGELFDFGLLNGRVPRLIIHRVDAEGRMDEPRVIELASLSFVHDFALTDHWLVFLLPEVSFALGRAMLGLTTPVGSLSLHTERPMTALLVPRHGGTPLEVPCCNGFVFHHANAYEDAEGRIHLDAIRFASFPDLSNFESLFDAARPEEMPRAVHLCIDPDSRSSSHHVISEHLAELPRVAPGLTGRQHPCFYAAGAPPGRDVPLLSAILRVESSGRVVMRDLYPDLPSEPVPADPEGRWLLVPVHRSERKVTDMLVLDGETLEEIACATAPVDVPIGFHGSFVPAG